MARIFTTPEAEQTAKAFLHDITIMSGMRSNNQRTYNLSFHPRYVTHATAVCDEIVNREFNNIDSAINALTTYSFVSRLDRSSGYSHSQDQQFQMQAMG